MDQKNYDEMSGADLVAEYNRLQAILGRPPSPIKKFETRAIGIRRIKAVQDEIEGGVPEFLNRTVQDVAPREGVAGSVGISCPGAVGKELTEDEKILREADARWRSWMPTRESRRRPRKSAFLKMIKREQRDAAKKAKAEAKTQARDQRESARRVKSEARAKASFETAGKRRRMDQIIRVTAAANPRREGTDAHRHFEAMVGGPTVGEYLEKFPQADHRKALQWLWNTCRDGHAKVLG